MLSDFRFALRQLLKARGFTAIAVLTLALGIGLNTSMFSLMNLLLLQPLPYPDSSHLVRIYHTTPQSQRVDHSVADYLELMEGTRDYAELAAFRPWSLTLVQGDHPPVSLIALRVSQKFFPVLGLQPELGRWFTKEEDAVGNHVLIISHEAWQAQFAGDPGVIGRAVRIDGESTTIIGVMPAEFSSVFLWGPADAFRPLAFTNLEKADRTDVVLGLVARYRAPSSLAQINSRLASFAAQLAPQRPAANSKDSLHAVTLQSIIQNPNTIQITLLLLGLAGFVLLIACANLANLQLARAVARTREFGIRAALGATRRRLLGPLLAESLLLAVAGGGFGILVAVWSNDWMSTRLSANGVVVFKLVLDWRVLSFAVVISLFTGLVFGIVPAWMMSRVNVNNTLKSGSRGSTGDRTQHRFRHSLIVAQFSLALVLLAGAGFFMRGLERMLSRDTGWNTTNLLQGVISLPQSKYSTPEKTYAFYTRLEERLTNMPGVEKATIGWTLPVFQFLASRSYVVDGQEAPQPGHEPIASLNGVMPSYLETLQVRLVSGRNFSATDTLTSPAVAVINQSMAEALFPHESPLGKRIGGLDPKNRGWMEIVGVVSDVRFAVSFISPPARFQVLRPLAQETWNYVSVTVRAPAAENLSEPLRHAVSELDPDLAVQQVGTVRQTVMQAAASSTMIRSLLIGFALLGLFLAAIGLYGVIARLVVQRTPEIGVRVALGAQSHDVIWLVLSSGIRLSLIGVAFGLVGSIGLAKFLALIAPDLVARDFGSVIVSTLLLVAVALLACWLPARRATKVDPMVALRSD